MSSAQNLILGTGSVPQIACREEPLPEQASEEADDTTLVLPSSDSIRSTKSDSTVSSWQTSSSASTLATSITSSLGKTASIAWSGLGYIPRPQRFSSPSLCSRTSRPRRGKEGSIDIEALPLQPLSECGKYDEDGQIRLLCPEPKGPASIQMTFDFGSRAHTYQLEYAVFRKWKYVSLLMSAVQADGVNCSLIWDEFEGLQVTAGDWEARVTPGWQIIVFCHDGNADDEDDLSEEDNEDEYWDVEKGLGGEWWFKSWKTRVEMKNEGHRRHKPWVIGFVAVIGLAAAFCIVIWGSAREHRSLTAD